jgi:hypothetical protein
MNLEVRILQELRVYFSDVRILKGLVIRRAIDGWACWTGGENSRPMITRIVYSVHKYLYGTHSNECGTQPHELPCEAQEMHMPPCLTSDGNVSSKPRPLGEGGYRTPGDGRAIRVVWSGHLVAGSYRIL